MKTITMAISMLTLSAFLAVSTPTMAQHSSDSTNTSATSNSNNDKDDRGKWGLLGLAGLLGLLGLKRRDDDRHRNTSVNR